MNGGASEVEVDDWRLGIIAGAWLFPDGDGYIPDRADEDAPWLRSGDMYLKGPEGVSASIAWEAGNPGEIKRMVEPRHAGDLGAFYVRTETPPTTRLDSEAFLRGLLPFFRGLTPSRDTRAR